MRAIFVGISFLALVASAQTVRAELEQEPLSVGIANDTYSDSEEPSAPHGPQSTRDQPSSIALRSETAKPQGFEPVIPSPTKDYSWWRWRTLTDY